MTQSPQPTSHMQRALDLDVAGTVSFIKRVGANRIALQLPDEFLHLSSFLVTELENSVNSECRFYILADTSFAPCCVDEVAAMHASVDAIVHYGSACLSRRSAKSLPVYFVFGRKNLDVHDFSQKFLSMMRNAEHKNISQWLVVYDLVFAYIVPSLRKTLASLHCDGDNLIILASPALITDANTDNFSGFCFSKPNDDSSLAIMYIGNGDIRSDLLLRFNRCQVFSYDPVSMAIRQRKDLRLNKQLMRRYYLIQEAKDAQVFGIVVATLDVARFRDVIAHLKRLVRRVGKQVYVLAVGKINAPKLCNFEFVDIFVIVACPNASLIDSRDFFKSIVSPFELELALNPHKEWTGDYSADFQTILESISEQSNDHSKVAASDDTPRVSLITGKLVNESAISSDCTDVCVTGTVTTQRLQSRVFRGLEPCIGETPVGSIEQGLSGLAMEYTELDEHVS